MDLNILRTLPTLLPVLGELCQYRSSFAIIYTRVKCSKIFGDRGQTFAPLGLAYAASSKSCIQLDTYLLGFPNILRDACETIFVCQLLMLLTRHRPASIALHNRLVCSHVTTSTNGPLVTTRIVVQL